MTTLHMHSSSHNGNMYHYHHQYPCINDDHSFDIEQGFFLSRDNKTHFGGQPANKSNSTMDSQVSHLEVYMDNENYKQRQQQQQHRQENKCMDSEGESMVVEEHNQKARLDNFQRISVDSLSSFTLQADDSLANNTSPELQKQWRVVTQSFLKEWEYREIRRNQELTSPASSVPKIRRPKEYIMEDENLQALESFYIKFDACMEELEDRNELIELEGFKQLVIRDLEEWCEASQKFKERLKVVQGQLMQKFVIDELIEEGLLPLEDDTSTSSSLEEEKYDDEDEDEFKIESESENETEEDEIDWVHLDINHQDVSQFRNSKNNIRESIWFGMGRVQQNVKWLLS